MGEGNLFELLIVVMENVKTTTNKKNLQTDITMIVIGDASTTRNDFFFY